jgi:hypothetical protein
MQLNLVKISKTIMTLGILTILTLASSTRAATIKMEVKVSGISSWVLVKYGAWPRYGGRVVYDATIGSYVTDDVARGETMRVTVTPTSGEFGGFYDIFSYGANRYVSPLRWVSLPFSESIVVPINPSFDNNYVEVASNIANFTARIPIGPRM